MRFLDVKGLLVVWLLMGFSTGLAGKSFEEEGSSSDTISRAEKPWLDSEEVWKNVNEVLPWHHIRHAKVQYAGSIGFFSVGAGMRIGKRYEPSLYYGLLARDFGGSSITVYTISLKNSFYLTQKPWLGHFYPKAGLSVNWGNTNNTFHKLPAHYPQKYYFQNMVHLAPFWGGEWKLPMDNLFFKELGLYCEFSALDAYLLEAIRTKYIKLSDIWSLGMGLTFYLP